MRILVRAILVSKWLRAKPSPGMLIVFCLISLVLVWPLSSPPQELDAGQLPITGVLIVTPGAMKCFRRMHAAFRKWAPTLMMIVGVEDTANDNFDYGLHTLFHRLPPNSSRASARNKLHDLAVTPLIFAMDENLSFESDFVPALRHFAAIIFESEYDIIGGCIRTGSSECNSYSYQLPHRESSNQPTFTIKFSSSSNSARVSKTDAVDNYFLAKKTALQLIQFDEQLESGESIDFFLRSLAVLRVGFSKILSTHTNKECTALQHDVDAVHEMVPLFHKWMFRNIVDPFLRVTTMTCADGQLAEVPESLATCRISTQNDLLLHSNSTAHPDPFPPFYSRLDAGSMVTTRTIGVVVAATGKYSKFLEPFISSFRKHFVPNSVKTFFVFANSWFAQQHDSDVVIFSQHSLGWPYNSLYRFRMALSMIDKMDVDYVFMADVDLEVIHDIDERILSDLVASIAPFSWGLPSIAFPYDRHPASPALLHTSEGGRYYFAGGFFGGSKSSVKSLLQTCAQMADAMLNMRPAYVSPWHDESILNRFFHKNRKPTLIAGPEFLYPEPPYDKTMLSTRQRLYARHVPTLMHNLGVRKAGDDKNIRLPEPTVLREFDQSVIQYVPSIKPFSCSAIANSESGALCGMFALVGGSFPEALAHCSRIGMQLCSTVQLKSLAGAGFCSCRRAWAAEGNYMKPRPSISECSQCLKCGEFGIDRTHRCATSGWFNVDVASNIDIVFCRLISNQELFAALSSKL
jgi:hypothetical protein